METRIGGKESWWLTAEPFAAELGWNERTIARYLPEKFKDAHQVNVKKAVADNLSARMEVDPVSLEAQEVAKLLRSTFLLKHSGGLDYFVE